MKLKKIAELQITNNSSIEFDTVVDFINKYETLFKTNEEIWDDYLNNLIDYIKENGKLPSQTDNNPIIKSLGKWISTQKTNYKNNKQILNNPEFRKKWEEFVNEYLN